MHLGIVAQGLKVPDAFHCVRNGLAVEDLPFVQRNIHVKALPRQLPEHLGLHPAHQAHMDALLPGVPLQVQLRILFLQLQQLRIQCGGVLIV